MISKTKFLLDEKMIKSLCQSAGIENIKEIRPLGDGEYNAVYEISADRKYALKIAPDANTQVLTYEKGMMKAELYWYDILRKNTSIRVPEIYYSDLSRKLINADWFVMEKLEGVPKNRFAFTPQEKEEASGALAKMAAEIHNISGDKFGYVQNKMYDNWYFALRAAAEDLAEDCCKKGRTSRRGKKFINYIDRHRSIFEKAPCTMVNYDIWDTNIICRRRNGNVEYAWIDPERSFWGDPVFDFCCLDFLTPLGSKKSLAVHNKYAKIGIGAGREEKIRYAASLAMMAFIMETERYYRYTPRHFGWWRNTLCSAQLYRTAFKELGK